MALPILDGNQSATTLSTILTGGQHIPAHTVVSLGSQAITDMRSAVSGSVVSISNFPASQTIAGTVTASIANSVTIGSLPYTTTITGVGSQFGQGGGLSGSVVTAVPVILSSNGNIGGSLMSYDGSNTSLNVNIKGTVPAISGTVTANALGYSDNEASYYPIPLVPWDETPSSGRAVVVKVEQTGVGAIPISGTVTANLDSNNFNGALTSYVEAVSSHNAFPVEIQYQPSVTIGSLPAISGTVTANIFSNVGDASVYLANPDNDTLVGASNPLPVAGSVSLGNISPDGGQTFKNFLSVKVDSDYYQVGLDRIVPEVSVTNLVNTGSLTSRSGTPTTANSVFATTCVTNWGRKYLLIQNVTTGGNVITVGVGLSPTTTRGIQLVAGAGITFESSFIPTGAVYVLSSVTASNFTILEGQ